MDEPLVSVIMPVYNGAAYLTQAISSVLSQSHAHLELLIVNDGSTDETEDVIKLVNDNRIRYFHQMHQGVSIARNVALKEMRGEYFCFLDSDDVMPTDSIRERLKIFMQFGNVDFVDGSVHRMDQSLQHVRGIWMPDFSGPPFDELLLQTGKNFFGQTWLIRRHPNKTYRFIEGLTHCEDLLFYLEITKEGGNYRYTPETILLYRDNPESAMKNLVALERGYRAVEKIISTWPQVSKGKLRSFRLHYKRAMVLAYLRRGLLYNAVRLIVN